MDDIEIKADSIVFDMVASTVFATGRTDTTGKVIGTPVFKQGTQEIESDSLFYNFVTRKAVAYKIVTQAGRRIAAEARLQSFSMTGPQILQKAPIRHVMQILPIFT